MQWRNFPTQASTNNLLLCERVTISVVLGAHRSSACVPSPGRFRQGEFGLTGCCDRVITLPAHVAARDTTSNNSGGVRESRTPRVDVVRGGVLVGQEPAHSRVIGAASHGEVALAGDLS